MLIFTNSYGLILLLSVLSLTTTCENKKSREHKFRYSSYVCFMGRWSSHVSKHQVQHFIEKENKSTLNAPQRNCDPLMVEAVKSRRNWIVKRILLQYNNISNLQRFSLQSLAYRLGHFEILDSLLAGKAESKLLESARLMEASCRGRPNTVATLLRNGAKVGDVSIKKTTEMLCAMSKNFTATVLALLKFGNLSLAYLNQKSTSGNPALYLALKTWKRFFKVSDKLLQLGVDVNQRFSNGYMPLVMSVGLNASTSVIALLLNHGAIINAAEENVGYTALHLACRYNQTVVVDLLLKRGANIYVPTRSGTFPFTYAVRYYSSITILASLLRYGASVNERGQLNSTALYLAAQVNASAEVVSFLLSRQADVNLVTISKDTALHAAVSNDQLATARLLIDGGANVNAANFRNVTPLLHGSQVAGVEVVKLLLQHGGNVNAKDNLGWTALEYASSRCSLEIVELLLKYGALVNDSNREGGSSLMIASKYNKVGCVNLLLQYGADVNAADHTGYTVLMFAVIYRASLTIIETLLKNNANVNALGYLNETTILYAIRTGRLDVLSLLIRYGADVNAPYNEFTPLQEAIKRNKSVEVVRILLENGAQVNTAERSVGMSPLMLACQFSGPDVVRLLIDNGAEVNQRAFFNFTALFYAAMFSNGTEDSEVQKTSAKNGSKPQLKYSTSTKNVISMLLQNGANVNAVAKTGLTALIMATSWNQTRNARLLLDAGANVNARTSEANSRTALISGLYYGTTEMVAMLLEHGANMEDRFENRTALMFSIESNVDLQKIQLLIRYGAVINATTPDGSTALSIAKQNGRRDVADVLIKMGAAEGFSPPASPPDRAQASSEYPFSILKSSQNIDSKTQTIAILGIFSGFYDSASSRCLLEIVNSYVNTIDMRQAVLPDYTLEVHYFGGETADISLAPQILDNFIAWQNITESSGKVVHSPVVLGPLIPCSPWSSSHVGVMRALRIEERLNHLGNIYAENCAILASDVVSPIFQSGIVDSANETEAIMLMAVIGFAKSVSWKQFSLICLINTNDPFILLEMPRFHRRLITNGIDINALHIGESSFDIFTEIKKQPRERVLFIANYRLNCSQCIDLLCTSYRAGITPDRYAVLMIRSDCLNCYVEMASSVHPQKCSFSIQQAQMSMFFFGMPQYYVQTKPREFGEKIWAMKQTISHTSKPIVFPADLNCSAGNWQPLHDSLITAIYLLHATDMKLKAQYRTNLFGLLRERGNRSNVALVEKVLAESAAEAELQNADGGYWYTAKRTGVIVQANFDKKTMTDSSVKRNFEWRVVAKMWPATGRAPDGQFQSYEMAPAEQQVIWATQSGKPPKDLSTVALINGSYNESVFLAISTIAVILTVFQIALMKKAEKRTLQNREKVYFDQTTNLLLATGCIFFNFSTVILLTGAEYFPRQICLFRPLFTVSSLTFINGTFFSKMLLMPKFAHEHRYISRKSRKPNLFNEEFHEEQRRHRIAILQKKNRITVGVIVLVAVLIQIIWFSSDPMLLKHSIEYESDPLFDTNSETYYVIQIEWCESNTQYFWIAFFAILQAVLLVTATGMGLAMKQEIKFVRKRFKADIVHQRMAINNSATIMVFTSFLMVAIPSRPASIFFMKTLAFVACQLVFSASSVGIIFLLIWSPILSRWRVISADFIQKLAKWRRQLTATGNTTIRSSVTLRSQTASNTSGGILRNTQTQGTG